jgi:hypothetical protein
MLLMQFKEIITEGSETHKYKMQQLIVLKSGRPYS